MNTIQDCLFQPDQLIANKKFKIIRLISLGGMSEVYQCLQTQLNNKNFALKVLRKTPSNQDLLKQFHSEVLTILSINHPNVIRGYEFIEEQDYLAFTMEYIEGGKLTDLIKEPRYHSYSEIIDILVQILEGLNALHQVGVIHRDLKPDNILIANNIIKLSDFGISVNEKDSLLLDKSKLELGGTEEYFSPEYSLNKIISKQLDIYSFGIIAYQLISKEYPFGSDDLIHKVYKQKGYHFKPLKAVRLDCPNQISQIVMKCLEADSDKRYSNCQDIIKDLNNYVSYANNDSKIVSDLFELTEDCEEKVVTTNKKLTDSLSSKKYEDHSIFFLKYKKNDRNKLLYNMLIGLLAFVISSFLLFQFYLFFDNFRSYVDRKILGKHYKIKVNNIDKVSQLNNQYILLQKYDDFKIKMNLDFKRGTISNLAFLVYPNDKSKIDLIQLTKNGITKSDNNTYSAIFDVKLFLDEKHITQKISTTGQAKILLFQDTGIAVFYISVPTNLDLASTNKELKIDLKNKKNPITFYAKLVVDLINGQLISDLQ